MNHSPSSDATVEEQAALWAARLDGGSLNREDRATLDQWLAADARHRAVLAEYCQFSSDLEAHIPALVAAGGINMPEVPPRRRRWGVAWFGALTLATAAAVVVSVQLSSPSSVETIATSVAQRKTHTLADGTQIELNAHTSLLIENTRSERRVRLAQGEALFNVAKDASRPFIVETPAGSIRVTGTVFNVRSQTAEELEVAVVEGSVQVRCGATAGESSPTPVALTANDQLTMTAKGVVVRSVNARELDGVLAWRRGQVVFDGVPLAEALNRFRHYHGRHFVISSGAAAARIGGTYSIDDLNGFLAGIETALRVRVTYDLSGQIHIGLQSETTTR